MGETSFNLGIYVDDRLAKATEIVSGNLPDGLELDSGHFIRGTATRSGTFPLTLRSTYTSVGRTSTATGSFTITVLKNSSIKQPTISGSFSNGEPNEPYSSKIYASDGDSNSYEWDYSGTLPNGLTLSAARDTYELVGTPTKADSYTFTVYLWDKYEPENGKASKTFTVEIGESDPDDPYDPGDDKYPEISGTFSDGVENRSYSSKVSVINGTAPYDWTYDESELPEGLTITGEDTDTVTLSGTPTKAGEYTFTLYFGDAKYALEKTFTVKITDGSTPGPTGSLSIKYKFAGGYINSPYEDWIMAVDNNGKCTWTGEGSLPSGLSLQTSGTNNEYVTLKGTPSESGSYEFTLSVKDSGGKTANGSFTVTIASGRNGSIESDPEKETHDDTARTTTNIQRIEVIEKKEENVNHTVSLGGGGCESGFGVISVIALGIMLRRRYQ